MDNMGAECMCGFKAYSLLKFMAIILFIIVHPFLLASQYSPIYDNTIPRVHYSLHQELGFNHILYYGKSMHLPDQKAKAVFCVIENKIQSASKIPIFIRLGSLRHSQYYESKTSLDPSLNPY